MPEETQYGTSTSRRPMRVAAASALLLGLFSSARGAAPAIEAKAGPDAVNVEVFQDARILSAGSNNVSAMRQEGWAKVNLMVDAKGKPYEATVTDSSGVAVVDKAAIAEAYAFSYAPAKRGSTPVDSSLSMTVIFFPGRSTGASSEFLASYMKAAKAIDAGNRAGADMQMAGLKTGNLYENAFRHYLQYFYDRRWGTERGQLQDLRGAVADEGPLSYRYLPSAAYANALEQQLALDVKLNDFARALKVWKLLQPQASDRLLMEWQPRIDQIKAARNTDQLVVMSEQIDTGPSWNGTLFKKRFDIKVTSGSVSEIKLRCQGQYLFWKYQAGVQYTVDPAVRECRIEVVGEPGTKFDLNQS